MLELWPWEMTFYYSTQLRDTNFLVKPKPKCTKAGLSPIALS
jgi:hypothetical protein